MSFTITYFLFGLKLCSLAFQSSPYQRHSLKVGKKEEGARDETNVFGFSLTQCFSFECLHILLVTSLNGALNEASFFFCGL